MKKGWLRNTVIIFLALTTVFAFSPFVLPSSQQVERTPPREDAASTSTSSVEADLQDEENNAPTRATGEIPVGIKAPSFTSTSDSSTDKN